MAQRRLAAIMFSDIVGYSSLLEQDEKKAFDTRKKNQRIHKRLIKKFNGRVLKEMGSSTLASFSSIIDAVMCSLSIQKTTQEIGISIRIGIHQGEVIFEQKDVLGDGVNIASRIQNLADSNGIAISEKVYSDIANKKGLEIEFLGEQALKGVSKPVGIYKVSCTNESLLDFTIDTGELVRPLSSSRTTRVVGIVVIALLAYVLYYFLPRFTQSSSKLGRSVLILPFENFTSDTLDYFAEGMHDILIGNVGKISALRVLGQTTANTYKDTEKSLTEIAKEREVNTFIEGAVLCIGDSICLQMKLLDQDGNEVWTQDFEVEISQILNLYNTITKEISSELGVLLTSEEKRLLAKSRTVNREAYDAFLSSHQYWGDGSLESLNKAKEYLNSAIEKDSDWAPLYAGLAKTWLGISQMGYESAEISVPKIYENLGKALELDPDNADAHYLSALIAYLAEWDWGKSEREFLKAIAMNPNDAFSRMYYAHLLIILQRPEEAVVQAQLAYELDPLDPVILILYSVTFVCADDCENATLYAEKALNLDPENFMANEHIGEVAFHCGDYDTAFEIDKLVFQGYSQGQFGEDVLKEIDGIFQEQGYFAAYEKLLTYYEILADKGLIGPGMMAVNYVIGNQKENALDWLEIAYEIRDPQMPYITSGCYPFDILYGYPRFIAIVKKMNLPLP